MSLFRSMKRFLKHRSATVGRNESIPRNRFVSLHLERLEDRRVLSGASAVLLGDLLLIEGGTAPDPIDSLITISVHDGGILGEQLRVDLGSQIEWFNSKDIATIDVRLYDGNDLLVLAIPSETKQPLTITVDGGDGDDTVYLTSQGPGTGIADRITILAESIQFQDPAYYLAAGDLDLTGNTELVADQQLFLGGDLSLQGSIIGPDFGLLISTGGKLTISEQVGTPGNELRQVDFQATAIAVGDIFSQDLLNLDAPEVTLSGTLSADSVSILGDLEIDGPAQILSTHDPLDLRGVAITGGTGDSLTLQGEQGVLLGKVSGLDQLTASTTTGTLSLWDDISTTGGQHYQDAVDVQADILLTASGIRFDETVTGIGHTLTIHDSGVTHFAQKIILGGLVTDAPGQTELGIPLAPGLFEVNVESLAIRDTLILHQPTRLDVVQQAELAAIDDLGQGRTLEINASGTTLTGNISVGSLKVVGPTVSLASQIVTTGEQFFDSLKLAAAATLSAQETSGDELAIHVQGPLDGGGFDLTAQGGLLLLGAAANVAGLQAIHHGALALDARFAVQAESLSVDGRSRLDGSVTTALDQLFGDEVLVGKSLTFTGRNVTFEGRLDASAATVTIGIDVSEGATFRGDVGGALLNGIEIVSAHDVEFQQSVEAGSLIQSSGSGMTSFQGAMVTRHLDGVQLVGTNFTFFAPVETHGGGGVAIHHTGELIIGPMADLLLDGAFSQTGVGQVWTAGNILTSGGAVSFAGAVVINDGANVTFDTTNQGSIGADIHFANRLDGSSVPASLTLVAGAGDIRFEAEIGQLHRLHALTIVSAHDVLFQDRVVVDGLLQQSGTGTTTIVETVTIHDTAGIDLATGAVVQQGDVDTRTAALGGEVRFRASDSILIDAEIRSGSGAVEIAANQDVSFTTLGRIDSESGSVRVMADADHDASGSGGSITMADGAIVYAGIGTIELASDGDITLASLMTLNNTAQAIRIESVSGGILDGGDTNLDLVANAVGAVVTIRALTGIGAANPLETRIAELIAEVRGPGGVRLDEQDALTVISLTTANGRVELHSGAGMIIQYLHTATTDNDANDVTITVNAGDLLIGVIEAGVRNDVVLNVSGQVRDDGDPSTRIRADQLEVTAGSGIDLDTEVAELTARVTLSGDLLVRELDNLVLTSLETADGTISVVALGHLTASEVLSANASADPAQGISLTAGSVELGRIVASGNAGISLESRLGEIDDVDGDALLRARSLSFLTAGGFGGSNPIAIEIDELVIGESSGPGVIRFRERDNLTISHLINADGAIDLEVGGVLTAVNVAAQGGTDADDISLSATSLRLGRILAAGAGDVAIVVTAGNVTDHLPGESLNITGDEFSIRAVTGIGLGAIGDVGDLNLAVNTVAAVTDSGSINLKNLGNLTIGTVAGLQGLEILDLSQSHSLRDVIAVHSEGTLNVAANVTNGNRGAITLVADQDLVWKGIHTVETGVGAILIAAGGNPLLGLPSLGRIDMVDGALIQGLGDVDLVAGEDITLGRIVTPGRVGLHSEQGGVIDAGDFGGVDIVASKLGIWTATGFGSNDSIETSVGLLAAFNTGGAGTFHLVNTSTPRLTIGDVLGRFGGPLSGIVNAGTGPGGIQVENVGGIEVHRAIRNDSGGGIVLIAHDSPGSDDTLTFNAPLTATGTAGFIHLKAHDKVILTDTPALADIHGRAVRIDAGTELVWPAGVFVWSFNGVAAAAAPYLADFNTPQITAQGIGTAQGTFGRTGEAGYIFTVNWSDGTIDTYFQWGDETTPLGPPGGVLMIDGPQPFAFFHQYTGPVDPDRPSAPTPIDIRVSTSDSLLFTVGGKAVNFVTDSDEAPNPGEGNNAVMVFDLSIEVPELEAPRIVLGETVQEAAVAPVHQVQQVEVVVVAEAEAAEEERFLIIERIAADGRVDLDAEGKPLRVEVRGSDAQGYLDNLDGLFQKLDSGRWRIYLREGTDGQSQLVRDVLLRNGKPAGGDAGTQDRPPTDDGGARPGTSGLSPDPLLPEMSSVMRVATGEIAAGEPGPRVAEHVEPGTTKGTSERATSSSVDPESAPVVMFAPLLLLPWKGLRDLWGRSIQYLRLQRGALR